MALLVDIAMDDTVVFRGNGDVSVRLLRKTGSRARLKIECSQKIKIIVNKGSESTDNSGA